jgi:hypothetical protein
MRITRKLRWGPVATRLVFTRVPQELFSSTFSEVKSGEREQIIAEPIQVVEDSLRHALLMDQRNY